MDRATTFKIRLQVVPALLLALLAVAPAAGADALKLMVTDCQGAPLDGATVRVVLHRAGGGSTERANGVTQDGYVEFQFDNLQTGDEARVTVIGPDGSDAGHGYVWQRDLDAGNPWDISDQVGPCVDGWWNGGAQVIRCAYDGDR